MTAQNSPTGWAEQVLYFWFAELRPNDWFGGSAEVDEAVRSRFADLYRALQASPLLPQSLAARSLLAAVIVFDQFPRNLFRSSAAAYATDARALELARYAVATGLDRSLREQERHFLYLPFMHSEDRAAQAESLRLYAQLGTDGLQWARHHAQIVERFGRFPHRNALLGRASTPEEREFLKTEPSFS